MTGFTQSSHETILVQIPPGTIDDLFVQIQTDQILLVKGRLYSLLWLIGSQYTP